MMGRIHSIQTLGTVDGPGVRFVAFLQGCPLRCGCCHNPDTWSVTDGTETTAAFDRASMTDKLNALTDEETYGIVLRAKGIVAAADGGSWIHFDYVPGEPDVREGGAAVIGRLCIIGANLNMPALSELFGVELK